MIQISKDEASYIRSVRSDAFITICSKRKKGSKSGRVSGKTYYCPESKRYLDLIDQYRNRITVQ